MMRAVVFAVVCAGFVVGGAGCQSTSTRTADTAEQSIPEDPMKALKGTWVPIWLNGVEMPDMDRGPIMDIDDGGQIDGFAGVNRFSSKVDVQGLATGKFELGPIAATKMAGPPERMAIEARFTRALDEVNRYTLRERMLILHADGVERVRLVQAMAR